MEWVNYIRNVFQKDGKVPFSSNSSCSNQIEVNQQTIEKLLWIFG